MALRSPDVQGSGAGLRPCSQCETSAPTCLDFSKFARRGQPRDAFISAAGGAWRPPQSGPEAGLAFKPLQRGGRLRAMAAAVGYAERQNRLGNRLCVEAAAQVVAAASVATLCRGASSLLRLRVAVASVATFGLHVYSLVPGVGVEPAGMCCRHTDRQTRPTDSGS